MDLYENEFLVETKKQRIRGRDNIDAILQAMFIISFSYVRIVAKALLSPIGSTASYINFAVHVPSTTENVN